MVRWCDRRNDAEKGKGVRSRDSQDFPEVTLCMFFACAQELLNG